MNCTLVTLFCFSVSYAIVRVISLCKWQRFSHIIMTSPKFFSVPNALHVGNQFCYPTPAYFWVIYRLIFWTGEILTRCVIELNSNGVWVRKGTVKIINIWSIYHKLLPWIMNSNKLHYSVFYMIQIAVFWVF